MVVILPQCLVQRDLSNAKVLTISVCIVCLHFNSCLLTFYFPACNGALSKDPSEDEHVCKPWYINRRSKKSSNSKDPFQCQKCQKEYSRQTALFNHIATGLLFLRFFYVFIS